MSKLLMVTGLGSAKDLATGKRGAFYNTLEEFHQYWDRVDIISPKVLAGAGHPAGVKVFDNVFVHTSPWPLIFHPIWFIKKGLALHRVQHFDLMTVQEFPPFYNGIGGWLLSLLGRIPYVLEVMHVPGHPRAANLKEWIYKKLSEAFLDFDAASAKAVRVINQTEMSEFLIRAGLPQKKLLYIPANYIDLDIFKPSDLPKKYDLIFVGRLVENKGINLLLEAIQLSIINYQFPMKCLIVGDGPLKKDCELKIDNWKMSDHITLHGWAKDSREIAALMNRSKILVMPSYNEGGPRVVLEAMACGLPVLATRVGIVPDVIRNEETGYIIDWDAADITAKARLLLEGDAYRRFVPHCLSMAKPFEREAAIKQYANVLQKILS
ncbi:MAG: hypothetical protein A3C88_02565 [Candidatus Yanofskybacteria bacterium RIFCSPHIGHO2_02_FULL_50_12]|uniref:Glycosyl transferase family 1 domain-containing protein n=1 Tax=Candidatus Yanofskybacteria bacterium RIFCSPHIGHO2_02_FULL_50_12 TaxID=1802685 RepID=A0A1F8FSU5_9BACT|nr:MAG: hypothetical protein A3C88_02565 [Candidatus Yanofskybacteria bacterium RIFCSPHIGHO2_02_FULL_50_12]